MNRPSSASAAIGSWVRRAATAISAARQRREEGDLLARIHGRIILHDLLVDRGKHPAAGGQHLQVGIMRKPPAQIGDRAAVIRNIHLPLAPYLLGEPAEE